MSITATTLSAAVAATDTVVNVAAATNITGPTPNTGAGLTYLKIDNEMMFVSASPTGTSVPVVRGVSGTYVTAHESSAPVLAGAPTDFPNFVPVARNISTRLPYDFTPIGAPLAITSNTVAPLYGYVHHVTGTTILKTITVPSGLVSGGKVTLVFDGSGSGLQWDATGNIAVAGTATTAASAVDFFYDPASAKWIPSRLA